MEHRNNDALGDSSGNVQGNAASVVNVRDFGAAGDGITDDTHAFTNALESLQNLNGGGLLVVDNDAPGADDNDDDSSRSSSNNNNNEEEESRSSNNNNNNNNNEEEEVRRYMIQSPLQLIDNLTIRLGPGVVIAARLIYGDGVRNVTLEGSNNDFTTTTKSQQLQGLGAPSVVTDPVVAFWNSANIRLSNLRLRTLPLQSAFHFEDCRNVHIRNIYMDTALVAEPLNHSSSTKKKNGIVLDRCSHAMIEYWAYVGEGSTSCVSIQSSLPPTVDCSHDNNDDETDGISTVNVTVQHFTCQGPRTGIAIGGSASEHTNDTVWGRIQDVKIIHGNFVYVSRPMDVQITTSSGPRSGQLKNLWFENLIVTGATTQVARVNAAVMTSSKNDTSPCPLSSSLSSSSPLYPLISNVTFMHIQAQDAVFTGNGEEAAAFSLVGRSQDQPLERVFLQDVKFGHAWEEYSSSGSSSSNTAWDCHAVQGAVVSQSVTPWPPCPELEILQPLPGPNHDEISTTHSSSNSNGHAKNYSNVEEEPPLEMPWGQDDNSDEWELSKGAVVGTDVFIWMVALALVFGATATRWWHRRTVEGQRRSEYRFMAANYTQDAFREDYSVCSDDDNVDDGSDVEEENERNQRRDGIQMRTLT